MRKCLLSFPSTQAILSFPSSSACHQSPGNTCSFVVSKSLEVVSELGMRVGVGAGGVKVSIGARICSLSTGEAETADPWDSMAGTGKLQAQALWKETEEDI